MRKKQARVLLLQMASGIIRNFLNFPQCSTQDKSWSNSINADWNQSLKAIVSYRQPLRYGHLSNGNSPLSNSQILPKIWDMAWILHSWSKRLKWTLFYNMTYFHATENHNTDNFLKMEWRPPSPHKNNMVVTWTGVSTQIVFLLSNLSTIVFLYWK